MILKYGDYAHAAGEVTITVSKDKEYAETGQQTGYKETWTIKGILHAATVSAVTAALTALETAYSVNGRDLLFYEADGVTPTNHGMISNGSATGVRIAKFSYPIGDGAEYSTYRTYEIEAEAHYLTANAEFDTWTQTINIRGGGPRFIYLQTMTGQPQKQQVAQSTPYMATQSGTAVGLLRYPSFPAPMFPAHEHVDQRSQTKVSPEIQPNTPTHYQIEWSYEFESASPLFGQPGIP